MKRAFSFLIGALVGGMIGASAALLFAPSGGRVLQDQIAERTQGWLADVRTAANQRRIELQERLDTLRSPRL
jgi:gas vesicle protein